MLVAATRAPDLQPIIHEAQVTVLRPLRRAEYDRMVELGFFEDEHVELLNGVLVPMGPQGTPHMWAIERLNEALVLALHGRARIRPQGPLAASDISEPEPDVAVVRSGPFSKDHPESALLVIEVSDSSLRTDRGLKAEIYARANVQELWIVNLRDEVFEVSRQPHNGRYTQTLQYGRGQSVAIEAFPDVTIRVDDVLPPAGT